MPWKFKGIWRRLLWSGTVFLASAGLLFVLLVGPWPSVLVDRSPAEPEIGEVSLNLEPGTCQAGRASRTVASSVEVKALAIGNGRQRVVILTAAVRLLPERMVRNVRHELGRRAGLAPAEILTVAVGGEGAPNCWGNLLARSALGTYDAALARQVSEALVQAGLEAAETMAPALVGSFQTPLRGIVVDHLDGNRSVLLYGAAAAERQAEGLTINLPGVLPDTPEVALAAAIAQVRFQERISVATWGATVPLSPPVARLGSRWCLSPVIPWLAGARRSVWVQAVRVGDEIIVAFPVEVQDGALAAADHLWVVPFADGYQGRVGTTPGMVPLCGTRSPEPFREAVQLLASRLSPPEP